jgi:hypothetical protein
MQNEVEGVFITITHFSNSDNTHRWIQTTFKCYHKINCIYYIFKQETLSKN